MFRSDQLDVSRPSYREETSEALDLPGAMRGMPTEKPGIEQIGHTAGPWCLVHGFTMLMLDGRLTSFLNLAQEHVDVADLLEAVLLVVQNKNTSADS